MNHKGNTLPSMQDASNSLMRFMFSTITSAVKDFLITFLLVSFKQTKHLSKCWLTLWVLFKNSMIRKFSRPFMISSRCLTSRINPSSFPLICKSINCKEMLQHSAKQKYKITICLILMIL